LDFAQEEETDTSWF